MASAQDVMDRERRSTDVISQNVYNIAISCMTVPHKHRCDSGSCEPAFFWMCSLALEVMLSTR